MNAIEIKGLTKNYQSFSLEGITLELPSGCIMGLVGENGAGKSTLIKAILDIISRDGGSVKLLGRDISEIDEIKEDIGVVLDEVGISACLTPRQVGRIMSSAFKNWDGEAYSSYLSRLRLPENKKFGEFSKGMKMKLGIAVALSHRARLLILDEATSGLDPIARDDILDILSEFTRDEANSVLISSHIVSDLEKICDYIAFIGKGRLMLCDEKDVLRDSYVIVNLKKGDFEKVPKDAVIGKKVSPYGVEAIIRRDALGNNTPYSQVDIEQLFIFMSKEEKR